MIRYIFSFFAAAFLSACASVAPSPSPQGDTIRVMVLGTYHFGNPGLDVVNMKADNVLAPERQAELAALADQLATFQPTAVAVESTWRDENLLSEGFKAFKPADLGTKPNEVIQIAYRLANQAGIDRVYAIDENEGDVAFFPFDRVRAVAEETGQMDLVDSLISEIQRNSTEFEAAQETETISELLARLNTPETIRSEHNAFHYSLFAVSEPDDPAGATLNYGWYARNALIFSNLVRTTKPGDRIVVLYGAGHAYWLRHFIEETPGFELEETLPYLMGQTANGS
jgi:hypothetical protein